MEFDSYTIALLVKNPDAPELDEAKAAELQDAHMAHLADLQRRQATAALTGTGT